MIFKIITLIAVNGIVINILKNKFNCITLVKLINRYNNINIVNIEHKNQIKYCFNFIF